MKPFQRETLDTRACLQDCKDSLNLRGLLTSQFFGIKYSGLIERGQIVRQRKRSMEP